MVRDDGRHRPPLDCRPRQRRQGGLPGAGPGRRLRQRPPRAPPGPLPGGPPRGRRHGRSCETAAARARIDRCARRCSADCRRHRRESAQAQRRVRARLARVRGRSEQRHGSGRRERRVARILPGLPGRESFRLRGNDEDRQRRTAGHAGDVLRRHRLPPPGLADRRRRLRGHRAATAPPPRHARRDRRDAEAPPPRAHRQRRHRRGDRRTLRDAHRPRAVGRVRPDARVRCRPSRRPAQPSVAADRADRPPRTLRRDRRRLVAGANGRSAPRHAGALGAAAQAEARTPLGDRGRRADRGRHRLSRTVEPRQAAAHRRRDRGDDRRLPAPRPAGDPRLLRPGRASLHRAPIGASRPRSLPGPFRSGARRGHPRPRHRGDGRDHRLCRGGEESGRAGQPVRPTDAGLPRPTGAFASSPRSTHPLSSTAWPRASDGSPPNSTGQP